MKKSTIYMILAAVLVLFASLTVVYRTAHPDRILPAQEYTELKARRLTGNYIPAAEELDIDASRRGSSFSHDEVLRQQALDAAKEVHQWGAPKTLPPMNSHDRRIVHITLEGDTALTTNSIGDGEKRSVVIALKEEVNA